MAPRILLLYRNSLLAEGLLNLLRERPGLEVNAKQLDDSNPEGFLRQLAPDIVIVDREDVAARAGITIDELLREGPPHMRVVDISSQNDFARVYEGQQIRVAKLDDLLAAFARQRG